MLVCFFILLFVRYELSVDKYHEKSDRIFRVTQKFEEAFLGGNDRAAITSDEWK